jgi:PD-(D/E)XK nuclease superfamily
MTQLNRKSFIQPANFRNGSPQNKVERNRCVAFRRALSEFVPRLEVVPTGPEVVPIDYGRLSEWFDLARKRYKQNEGNRRFKALRRKDRKHPFFGTVSLLGPLSLGLRELAHTSMLAWLLDPGKEHGFGSALLVEVLRRCYPKEKRLRKVWNTEVSAEAKLDSHGRVDIRVRGGSGVQRWLLLIEAKIDAREGSNQLDRYARYAQIWQKENPGGKIFRLYLVRDKQHRESPMGWKVLDYKELVSIFLSASRGKTEAPGYFMLRYYLTGVLKEVMEWPMPIVKDKIPYEAVSLMSSD